MFHVTYSKAFHVEYSKFVMLHTVNLLVLIHKLSHFLQKIVKNWIIHRVLYTKYPILFKNTLKIEIKYRVLYTKYLFFYIFYRKIIKLYFFIQISPKFFYISLKNRVFFLEKGQKGRKKDKIIFKRPKKVKSTPNPEKWTPYL